MVKRSSKSQNAQLNEGLLSKYLRAEKLLLRGCLKYSDHVISFVCAGKNDNA